MSPIIVVVNSTGLQGRPVVHAASAAGFQVRAQTRSASKPEAKALAALPNVTIVEGDLYDASFLPNLFKDADYAWVNTTHDQGDEFGLGKSLALAAKEAGLKHYVYSTLEDHTIATKGKWDVPEWAVKYHVEQFIRTLDSFPATFVYVGQYLENYNQSVLSKVERQEDGSILISGKLNPNAKLPVIELERDLGPAIVTILKEGPSKWNHKRVPLAYHRLDIEELAQRFAAGSGLKVTYKQVAEEIDPNVFLDKAAGVFNAECMYHFSSNVPNEARELNPNYHSIEDFAQNKWKKNIKV